MFGLIAHPPLFRLVDLVDLVSAAEIIEKIRHLSAEEREKVRNFARLNLASGQLTGEELAALGERMIATEDPAEAQRLEEEIVRGFYGETPHA